MSTTGPSGRARMPLDPEIAEALMAIGVPPPTEPAAAPSMDLLNTLRSMPLRTPYDPNPLAGVAREERHIAGPPGSPDVAIRIYRRISQAARAVPGLVWLHGGGYVLGSYDMDAPFLDPLVASTGCVAVSVDYRLAPEAPFPAGVEDAYAGLRYLFENAGEIGVDPSRLAIGGFSAGGGLAAAVALLAREQRIPLVHQHLLYPMIDDRLTTPSSQWDLLAVWSREMNGFAWRCYLGGLYQSDQVPPLAAPARATDLAGLPPAYVHVGTLDGFAHEDIDYAVRLLAAGVPAELHVFPGAPHGFDLLTPGTAIGRAATALSQAALARVLSA